MPNYFSYPLVKTKSHICEKVIYRKIIFFKFLKPI